MYTLHYSSLFLLNIEVKRLWLPIVPQHKHSTYNLHYTSGLQLENKNFIPKQIPQSNRKNFERNLQYLQMNINSALYFVARVNDLIRIRIVFLTLAEFSELTGVRRRKIKKKQFIVFCMRWLMIQWCDGFEFFRDTRYLCASRGWSGDV